MSLRISSRQGKQGNVPNKSVAKNLWNSIVNAVDVNSPLQLRPVPSFSHFSSNCVAPSSDEDLEEKKINSSNDSLPVLYEEIAHLRLQIVMAQKSQPKYLQQFENRILKDWHPFVAKKKNKNLVSLQYNLSGHGDRVTALDWFDNGEELLAATKNGQLVVWNVFREKKRLLIPHQCSFILSCAVSPNGELIACGDLRDMATVYNIKDEFSVKYKQPTSELCGHQGYISTVLFAANDKLISCSGDRRVVLWDINKSESVFSMFRHRSDVACAHLSSVDKSLLLTGSCDATVRLWDLRSGQQTMVFEQVHESDVNSVRFFPDGMSFASGSEDATIKLFDLRTTKQVQEYGEETMVSAVSAIDFSASGRFLHAAYQEDPYYVVWDTVSGDVVQMIDHPEGLTNLRTCPSGNCVATASYDKSIRIFG